MTCPRCRRALTAATCPGCGMDLTALQQVVELADRRFNEGLRAARAGRWHEASEALAVALAFRPDDLDATVLAARVARRQGRTARVAELADAVERLAPESADLADLRSPVPVLDRPRTAPPDGRATGPAGLPARPVSWPTQVRTAVCAVLARRPGGGARG